MRIKVRDIAQHGIISDIADVNLPPEAWSVGNNVRFLDNSIRRTKGTQESLGTPSVDPKFLLPWTDVSLYKWLYGNEDKLYLQSGGTHTDVTRAAGDYTASSDVKWNGGILGGVPILNNGVDVPQSWDSGTSKFQDLPNWTANTTAAVIRIFKQFAIALDLTVSGTNYPTLVRWSHPAAPGTVPTSWDITSKTVDAGEYSLSETQGRIIDCLPLGELNVIYKTDSIWFQRHVGGEFIFQSSTLFRQHGLIAQNCVREFDKKHFFVSFGDVLVHEGSRPVSVISQRVRKALFNELDDDNRDKIMVVPNYRENEMWVCIPKLGSEGLLAKAFIWNWKTGQWGMMELPSLYYAESGVILPGTLETFDSAVGTFDEAQTTIEGTIAGNKEVSILGGASGKLYEMDYAYTMAGNTYTSYVERTGIALAGQKRNGEITVDPTVFKLCTEFWPIITTNQNSVFKVYVGAQEYRGGPITWDGPFTFDPTIDEKVDPLIEGRYICIRLEMEGNADIEIHGYDLNIEPVGNY